MSNLDLPDLESRLQQATTLHDQIDLMNELAWHYCRTDPAHSQTMLRQVRALLDKNDYPTGEQNYKTVIARHHYMAAEYTPALQIAVESAAYYREHRMYRWLCWSLNIQAIILRLLGDYPRAIDAGQEYYRVAKEAGDLQETSIALNTIAMSTSNTGDHENALRYLTEAREIALSLDDHFANALMLTNIASMLRKLKRHDEAIAHCHESMALLEAHGYHKNRMTPIGQLGGIYQDMGDYAAAERWLQAKIDLLGDDGEPDKVMTARYYLARLFIEMERMDEALPILQEALAFYEMVGSKAGQIACHRHLADIYEYHRQYKQALQHHRQFADLKQQIFNEESDARLKSLHILFEVERTRKTMKAERQQYERLSHMKDELVGSTAHDLKNPLSSMMLTVDLLKTRLQHGQTEEIMTGLERLHGSILQMRDMVTGMLDIARLETGQSLQLEVFALCDLLQDIKRDFNEKLAQYALTMDVTPAAQTVYINADRLQIQRVFTNLLSNAVKFTPPDGQISVTVTADDATCTITFHDTGVGIEPDDLPHVFERFFRAENAIDNHIEGTGLGLAISRTIIEQHDGDITVTSEPETGTTFTVTLPRTTNP